MYRVYLEVASREQKGEAEWWGRSVGTEIGKVGNLTIE